MSKGSQTFLILCLIFLLRSVSSLCSTTCMGCQCRTCIDTNNCGSCADGFGVAFIGLYNDCAPCPVNCLQCATNNALCTTCSLGYGVIAGGQCDRCANYDCRNCQNSNTYCLECRIVDGVGLYAGDCTNCQIANCKDCRTNALTCVACNPGFGFTVNSTCESC